EQVERALREWWTLEKSNHPETWCLGYFGSYARGDWGVGSDLDLVALVLDSPSRFDQRSLFWDLKALPVSADLVVYTLEEWRRLKAEAAAWCLRWSEKQSGFILARPSTDLLVHQRLTQPISFISHAHTETPQARCRRFGCLLAPLLPDHQQIAAT